MNFPRRRIDIPKKRTFMTEAESLMRELIALLDIVTHGGKPRLEETLELLDHVQDWLNRQRMPPMRPFTVINGDQS